MQTPEITALDVTKLPKHFEAHEAERKWDEFWTKEKVYHFNESEDRQNNFVIDTPPPTVSGSLHIGHAFSYTHPDLIARQQRMQGKNVFYPMGWDDNGLPTERRVQNYFHVRCDPQASYEKNLKLEQASAKQRKDRPKLVSRQNFIELCHQVTAEDERVFQNLFRRLGLSVDWREEYATVDDHCRKLAQLSFLDLHQKQHVYQLEAPTMWDVDFQTAVAQAEIEDREVEGAYHDIEFAVEDSEESFIISTTRPELLPACVGVAAHPEDKRYKNLFGKNAITALFQAPVPIFATELADPEKGTGILMVCTFGDQTDVQWWREQKLKLRQIVGRNGRLLPIEFGTEAFASKKPDLANRFYAELEGKNIKQAKAKIVELLRENDSSATGKGPALQGEPKKIKHPVKFYEKGERPLEFVSTRQWFVRIIDKIPQLIEKGNEIKWHPDFMRTRFRNWTENLQIDWCISRQRYFGVSFPVWYPLNEKSEPVYEKAIVAPPDQLPVDPMIHTPPGFDESQRGQANGFVGEADVFDTWFTSSLTPQIGSHWSVNPERHQKLFPNDIRPQAHEIIRTWAFYTIAKAMLHEEKIPWKHAVISGWILDPDRKKMSKSKGNVVTPIPLLDEFSSDAVRYWAANARLGVDTAFDEKVLKVGKRLTTKIYNASKFVLMQSSSAGKLDHPLDTAYLSSLEALCTRVTKAFDDFNYAQALQETEKFFWSYFTDSYIELVKNRAKEGSGEARASAVASLRLSLNVILRLFAPFLPFITEEVWSWKFAEETGIKSIHASSWPSSADFEAIKNKQDARVYETALECYSAINKFKSANSLSIGSEVGSITIHAPRSKLEDLKLSIDDIALALKVKKFEFNQADEAEIKVL